MVKTSTLAIILAALIISVVFTGDADGAGLVWRAINKSGSSIHDIANVTERGCGLNQYLSVNSSAKWACTTLTTGSNVLLDGSVHTDTVAQTVSRGSIIYGDSTPKWNELVLGVSGQFLFSDGTDVKYGTIKNKLLDGSNHTDTASVTANRGDMIIADSSNLWNKRTLGASGLFLYSNGTEPVYGNVNNPLLDGSNHTDTVAQTVSRGSIIYGDSTPKWNELTIGTTGKVLTSDGTDIAWQSNIAAISSSSLTNTLNATLIADNSTDVSDIALKTISGSELIQIDNGTNTLTIKSVFNGTALTANVTSSTPQTHAKVFDIPLTANVGNTVTGVLTVSSSVAGNAVVAFANLTSMTNAQGYCLWQTPTAATTINPDFLLLNATGNAGGTAETTWLPAVNVAQPILFSCSVITGPTPPQLRIYIAPELTGSTAAAKAGSYAIISP